MPPGLPSHDTNTMPSATPPPAHGLSGALPIVRIADQVAPLSVDVIMRMFPVLPTFRYSWQTAYIVPPPSIATAGSPTNMPVLFGIETFLLQVMPPLVENENAHTRVERSSIQPASARPFGPGRQRDLGLAAVAGVVVEADVRRPGRRRQCRRAAVPAAPVVPARPRRRPCRRVRPSRRRRPRCRRAR